MYIPCNSLSLFVFQALADYRQTVLFHLSSLTLLDSRKVDVKEKVQGELIRNEFPHTCTFVYTDSEGGTSQFNFNAGCGGGGG